MQGKHTSIKRERDENDSYDQTFFWGENSIERTGWAKKTTQVFFPIRTWREENIK